MQKYLIVGLGNPGLKYAYTWHNLGFLLLSDLAKIHNCKLQQLKFESYLGQFKMGEKLFYLLQPLTYMNNSGIAVKAASRYLNIPLNNIYVLYDDFDLPFGDIRYRKQGGAGTHNGMRSIVNHLGSQEFNRLRIGAGPLKDKAAIVEFVLSQIPNQQLDKLPELAKRVNEFFDLIAKDQGTLAENRLHNQNWSTQQKLQERAAKLAAKEAAKEAKLAEQLALPPTVKEHDAQ